MEIIKAYLPTQLSVEEVEAVVVACIAEIGASGVKDLGKVMKAVYTKIDAAAAPKQMTSEIVKKRLA